MRHAIEVEVAHAMAVSQNGVFYDMCVERDQSWESPCCSRLSVLACRDAVFIAMAISSAGFGDVNHVAGILFLCVGGQMEYYNNFFSAAPIAAWT